MSSGLAGDELPRIVTAVPGPASRQLSSRLARVESRNITALHPAPIFWSEARGAAVRDTDGNIYVDLSAGFGVAHAGHANPAVASAIADQAQRLAHGLGDVYPPEPKVRLLEKLAHLAPGDLGVTILGNSGAEAVEAALKTAVLRTGRAGIIAFEGAYHGLSYGALAVTHRSDFRAPFAQQLFNVHFLPWPAETTSRDVLSRLDMLLQHEGIGAVIIEPIQGRGGIRMLPPGFLKQLRARCDGVTALLILDEIYTGCGRTGTWFACEHDDVVPDVLAVGKALSGSIPISAAIGTPDAMSGWPPSTGEAIHTSTFLGNPVACAAALAQLDAIEELDLLARARQVGNAIRERTERWHQSLNGVGEPRGLGLLQGVPLDSQGMALRVAARSLERGVIVLAEGSRAEVLAITPPAVITDSQLEMALDIVEEAIRVTEF